MHWLSGVVGLCSLLEHGGTKGTAANKKSAKTTTMGTATTTTTTAGVNMNTSWTVRSASVSLAYWGQSSVEVSLVLLAIPVAAAAQLWLLRVW